MGRAGGGAVDGDAEPARLVDEVLGDAGTGEGGERLAWMRDVGLGGRGRIEPGSVDAVDGAVGGGDAAQQFLRQPPRPLRRDPAVAAHDDALGGCLAPTVPGAVVDDEGLGAGGLDADAEAGEPVVPCDPALVRGFECVGIALVERDLDVGGSLAWMC